MQAAQRRLVRKTPGQKAAGGFNAHQHLPPRLTLIDVHGGQRRQEIVADLQAGRQHLSSSVGLDKPQTLVQAMISNSPACTRAESHAEDQQHKGSPANPSPHQHAEEHKVVHHSLQVVGEGQAALQRGAELGIKVVAQQAVGVGGS